MFGFAKKDFFKLENKYKKAKAGVLSLKRNEVLTPCFMPVATKASVKSLSSEDLKKIGFKIILSNTYHLHLRPSEKLIASQGGLHSFMNWQDSILTDSGGFQIYSLSKLNKLSRDGVSFKSHLDGSTHFLSPEKSMQIQMDLGSDIIMAFDECLAYKSSYEKTKESMELSLLWLEKCVKEMTRKESSLFGIIQGGFHLDLRKKSMERSLEFDLPSYALGGFSVGEPMEIMYEFLDELCHLMPENKAIYLMGVGKPKDIIQAVDKGVDLFDCVIPTREARNGNIFSWKGSFNIKNEKFKNDKSPLDPDCLCEVCKNYSKAYLRHLFKVGEPSSMRFNSYHNLYFYFDLMKKIRESILNNTWDKFKEKYLKIF